MSYITSHIKPIAQAGLTAKGIVYCLLGVITFMAAFHINGQSANNTDKDGVFSFVERQAGGQVLLGIIALGLVCYCLWRGIQVFGDSEYKGIDKKSLAKRGRYLLSGLVYGYLAFHVVMLIASSTSGSGDSKEGMASKIMEMPMGEWLVGLTGLILAGVGIYQIYYGLSEKYRKHVERAAASDKRKVLLGSGKLGYIARGIVWLLLAWLFLKAAVHSNSHEAGDTSKAFSYLNTWEYGAYLLAAVSFGLLCYGIFSFIRARYENFR